MTLVFGRVLKIHVLDVLPDCLIISRIVACVLLQHFLGSGGHHDADRLHMVAYFRFNIKT